MAASQLTTQFAYVIPETWSTTWFEQVKANTPMMNFFGHDYEGDLNVGDTVNVSVCANLVGEVLASGSTEEDVTPEGLTITNIPVVVNKIASVSVAISNLAKLQSIEFTSMLRQNMTDAIARKIEAAIVAALLPSSSGPDHVITTASSGVLAPADLATIYGLLGVALVPKENRALFADVAFSVDLLNSTQFTSSDFIPAASPIAAGAINSPLYGMQIVEANGLAADTAYACHKSCAQVIYQAGLKFEIASLLSNNKLAYILNASLPFGVKLMDNKRLVKITGA